MAQAGIHSIVSMALRKWTPDRKWLMLGIVLGGLLPDADNLAVAIATIAGRSTGRLHRTVTHSLITVAAVIIAFQIVALIANRRRLGNLGLGLGVGILAHIVLDLLVWFDGVEILWPIPLWVDLWTGITPPAWWTKLMMPAEFLFFALFFVLLGVTARKLGTDSDFLRMLRGWTVVQGALFIIFTPLVYVLQKGFVVPFGGLYLLSLGLAFGITLRMRETIEASAR